MMHIAICHADEDQRFVDKLETLLAGAERSGQVKLWHRRRIPFGSIVANEVAGALGIADLIILFLSPELLAKREEDLKQALAQVARGARLMPLQVRHAMPDERFEGLGMLPDDGRPLAGRSDAEEEWTKVGKEILTAARQAAKQAPPLQAQSVQAQSVQAPIQTQQVQAPAVPTPPPAGPLKILFLGANPSDATHLALDAEVKEIGRRIDKAQKRDALPLAQAWAVQLEELSELLLQHRPALLHFSGHGAPDGRIVLLDRAGGGLPAPQTALAKLFAFFRKRGLRCVVLNACFAEEQARLIAEHIECVVGISGTIKDKSAFAFSAGFYTGLAAGETLQEAFDLGMLQIGLMGDEKEAPRLFFRTDVDPTSLRFTPHG